MSSIKRWVNLKRIFTANGGCGCGPKTTDIVEPKLKSKTSSDVVCTPSSTCPPEDHHHAHAKAVSACPKISDSLAIVKQSEDPYRDFRQSMLQMIFEKELYSKDDLQQLLHCFLELNAPQHHQLIIRAFKEIWNASVAVAATPPPCRVPPVGRRRENTCR